MLKRLLIVLVLAFATVSFAEDGLRIAHVDSKLIFDGYKGTKKAQEEYAVKTGQTVGVEKVAAAAQAPAQQYIFRVDGSRTTEQTRGIKVQNGRKDATQ